VDSELRRAGPEWWYCQEPEKIKNFEGFAFKEKPYELFKKPDPMILHQAARELTDLVGINELHGKLSKNHQYNLFLGMM